MCNLVTQSKNEPHFIFHIDDVIRFWCERNSPSFAILDLSFPVTYSALQHSAQRWDVSELNSWSPGEFATFARPFVETQIFHLCLA